MRLLSVVGRFHLDNLDHETRQSAKKQKQRSERGVKQRCNEEEGMRVTVRVAFPGSLEERLDVSLEFLTVITKV